MLGEKLRSAAIYAGLRAIREWRATTTNGDELRRVLKQVCTNFRRCPRKSKRPPAGFCPLIVVARSSTFRPVGSGSPPGDTTILLTVRSESTSLTGRFGGAPPISSGLVSEENRHSSVRCLHQADQRHHYPLRPPRSTRKPRSLMCPASYTRTRNSVSIGSHTSGRCGCGIGFRRSQRSSSPSFCGGIGRVQHHGRSGSPLGPILGKASRLPKRERCCSEAHCLDNEYSDR